MYPNVKAELKRRGLGLEFVANTWEVTVPTASLKLSGKSIITLTEAKLLKEALGTDLPLEELYKEAR